MEKIYYATSNEGKVKRLKESLKHYNVPVELEQLNIQFPPEIATHQIEEIAKQKVMYAYDHLKIKNPVVALDAGFFIDALKGWPAYDLKNQTHFHDEDYVLRMLKDAKRRTCRLIESLAYYDETLAKSGEPETFQSVAEGRMAYEGRGGFKDWDWLSRLFIPKGMRKTLAELTDEERMNLREKFKTYHVEFAKWYLAGHKILSVKIPERRSFFSDMLRNILNPGSNEPTV